MSWRHSPGALGTKKWSLAVFWGFFLEVRQKPVKDFNVGSHIVQCIPREVPLAKDREWFFETKMCCLSPSSLSHKTKEGMLG